ncbi:hypothetical protein C493_16474, partial [Natronolimnohabitans innermongolicus JCM 12255]
PTQLENLAHQTALRLYPMAYFKSLRNRMDEGTGDDDVGQGWTFDEILDTEHTAVAVNDAIFGVQEDVFGEDAVDPYADRVMRPAWACLIADTLEAMADSDDAENGDKDAYEASVSVPDDVDDATVFVGGEKRGTTGADSEVTFDLTANETQRVVVVADGYDRIDTDRYFSEQDADHHVSLAPATDRTIGVYDSSGDPLADAEVNIWNDDELVYAETDADGTVDLDALDVDVGDDVTVEVFAEGYDGSSESLEADGSAAVVLTPADEPAADDLEEEAGLTEYFDDPDVAETVCEEVR